MDAKLKKKLAYYIAGMSFNHETSSTMGVLESEGIPATMEDAEEITDIASEIFNKLLEKSEGWEKAKELPPDYSRVLQDGDTCHK